MEENKQIVKNGQEGFNFKYASLSDIAQQGFKIPKMKTGLDTFGAEYVFYYDEQLKEWIQGAKVCGLQSKQMNVAQAYGAALTYARRYTTLLALGLATDDDTKIDLFEGVEPITTKGTDELKQYQDLFIQLLTKEQIEFVMQKNKVGSISELPIDVLKRNIEIAKVNNAKKQSN